MSIGCQGGFCAMRDKCPLYRPGLGYADPDRLCLPARDGHRLMETTRYRAVVVDVFTVREIDYVQ